MTKRVNKPKPAPVPKLKKFLFKVARFFTPRFTDALLIALSGYFDTNYYFQTYPGLLKEKRNPILEYVTKGVALGRNPNSWFETNMYLAQRPQLVKSGINPFAHYIYSDLYGHDESKLTTTPAAAVVRAVKNDVDLKRRGDMAGQIARTMQHKINAAFLHQKVFPKYKNIHNGLDIVLLGTGPSLNYYEQPMEGAIHCALNGACLCSPQITLDYFFTVHNCWAKLWDEETRLIANKTVKKFYGIISDDVGVEVMTESLSIRHNAERYFVLSHWAYPPLHYTLHIESEPLGCNGSVAFQAMQFLLYTNPRRIYLAGCDASSSGHFNNRDPQSMPPHVKDGSWADRVVKGWITMKKFIDTYYPDVEIISLNPVGLKGLFKDIYTVQESKVFEECL